jgi:hypothetical protein
MMYLCIASAGVSLWFIDIPFLANVLGLTYLMISVFLFVGGLVSGGGHLLRILVVEKAGYPLIISAMTVLAGVLFNESGASAARVFNGLLVFGFTLGLYGRWRDLSLLLRAQKDAAVRESGDG